MTPQDKRPTPIQTLRRYLVTRCATCGEVDAIATPTQADGLREYARATGATVEAISTTGRAPTIGCSCVECECLETTGRQSGCPGCEWKITDAMEGRR